MPPRDWRFRISDSLDSIERIQRYSSQLDQESFRRNQLVVDAVIRNLAVIGEAARHVPEDVIARHPDLPWEDMRDMRNVVVHEYFGVSLDVIWSTIQHNLPPLVPVLRRILEVET